MLPQISSFSSASLLANSIQQNSSTDNNKKSDDEYNNNNNQQEQEELDFHSSSMSKNTGLLPMTDLDATRWQSTLSAFTDSFAKQQLSTSALRSVFANNTLITPFDATQMQTAKPISQQLQDKKKWLEHRKTLAAYDNRNQIAKSIRATRVSIVCGDLGCGKSTYVPIQLTELDIGKKKRIIVVRPSVLAVAELADRLRAELNEPSETSHFVGDTSSSSLDNGTAIKVHSGSQIVVTTPEILLKSLVTEDQQQNANSNNSLLTNVGAIVFDEAQERTAYGDLLMLNLRSLIVHGNNNNNASSWKLVFLHRLCENSPGLQNSISLLENYFTAATSSNAAGNKNNNNNKDTTAITVGVHLIPQLVQKETNNKNEDAANNNNETDGGGSVQERLAARTFFLDGATSFAMLKSNNNNKEKSLSSASMKDYIKEGQTSLEVRSILQKVSGDSNAPSASSSSTTHQSGAPTTNNVKSSSSNDPALIENHSSFAISNETLSYGDDDSTATDGNNETDTSYSFVNSWNILIQNLIERLCCSSASSTTILVHLPSLLHARMICHSLTKKSSSSIRVGICDPDKNKIQYVTTNNENEKNKDENSSSTSTQTTILLSFGLETVVPTYSLGSRFDIVIDTCRSVFFNVDAITTSPATQKLVGASPSQQVPPLLPTSCQVSFSSHTAIDQRSRFAISSSPTAAATSSSSSSSSFSFLLISSTETLKSLFNLESSAATSHPQQQNRLQKVITSLQQQLQTIQQQGGSRNNANNQQQQIRNLQSQIQLQKTNARLAHQFSSPISRLTSDQLSQFALAHVLLTLHASYRSTLNSTVANSPLLSFSFSLVANNSSNNNAQQMNQQETDTWFSRMISALPSSSYNQLSQQLINHETVSWAIPFRLCAMGLISLSSLLTTNNSSAFFTAPSSSSSANFSLSPVGLFSSLVPSQISPSLFTSKLLAFGTLSNNRKLALGLASLFINGSVFHPFVREGREVKRFLSGNFPLSDVEAECRALKLYYSSSSLSNNNHDDDEKALLLEERIISEESIHNCEEIQYSLENYLTKQTCWWSSLSNKNENNNENTNTNNKNKRTPLTAFLGMESSSSVQEDSSSNNKNKETFENESQRFATTRFLLTSASYPDIFSTISSSEEANNSSSSATTTTCSSSRGSGVTLSLSVPSDSLLISPIKSIIGSTSTGVYPGVKSVASCGGGIMITTTSSSNNKNSGTSSSPFCIVSPLPSSMLSVLMTASSLASSSASSSVDSSSSSSSSQQHQKHFSTLQNNTQLIQATSSALQQAKLSKRIDGSTGATTNVVSAAAPCRGWWSATTQDWRTTSLARASNVVQPSAPQVRLEPVPATIFDPLQLPSTVSSSVSDSLLSGIQSSDIAKLSDLSLNTIAKIRNGLAGASTLWLEDEAVSHQGSSSLSNSIQMQQKIGEVLQWSVRRELQAHSFLRERRNMFKGVTVAKTKLIPYSKFTFGSSTASDIRDRRGAREYFEEVNQENRKLQQQANAAAAAAASSSSSKNNNSNHQDGKNITSTTTDTNNNNNPISSSMLEDPQTELLRPQLPFQGQKPTDQTTIQLIERTAGIVSRSGSRLKEASLSSDAFPWLKSSSEFHGYYLYLLKKLNPQQMKIFGDDIDELKNFMGQLENSIHGRGAAPEIPLPYDLNDIQKQQQDQEQQQQQQQALQQDQANQQQQQQMLANQHSKKSKVTVINNNNDDTIVEELNEDGTAVTNNQHQDNNNDPNQQSNSSSHFAYTSLPTVDDDVFAYSENAIAQMNQKIYQEGRYVECYPGYSEYDYNTKLSMGENAFRWQIDPTYDPLAEVPPKIPPSVLEKDPRFSKPFSVIVEPIPVVPSHITDGVMVILAKALGEFLGTKVGPTMIVGNIARIEVPNAAVETRAIAMKQFICLGKKLQITKNDKIYDQQKSYSYKMKRQNQQRLPMYSNNIPQSNFGGGNNNNNEYTAPPNNNSSTTTDQQQQQQTATYNSYNGSTHNVNNQQQQQPSSYNSYNNPHQQQQQYHRQPRYPPQPSLFAAPPGVDGGTTTQPPQQQHQQQTSLFAAPPGLEATMQQQPQRKPLFQMPPSAPTATTGQQQPRDQTEEEKAFASL